MEENNTKRFFYNIWPPIQRAINGIFYFVFSVVKGIVAIAASEVKNGGE